MSYLAIFKRIIPFFLTFAAGLFIASFFVTIATPNFGSVERGKKWRYYNEMRRENENLRRENCRLKREMEQLRRDAENVDFKNLKLVLPEVEVDVPAPPAPPRAIR
jgi:hypothetical protein